MKPTTDVNLFYSESPEEYEFLSELYDLTLENFYSWYFSPISPNKQLDPAKYSLKHKPVVRKQL